MLSRRTLVKHLRDPVYGNGVALMLNAASGAVLGFLFWMIAARLFAAEDLGFGVAVVSAATLAALVGKAGFDAALIRFLPHVNTRYARKLLVYALGATVFLTLAVCGVILALAAEGVESLAPLRTPLAATGFLLLAAGTSAAWILDAFYIAEQQARITLARNVAFNGVKLLVPLAIAASLAAYAVPIAWAVGLAASLAVSLGLLPRFLHRKLADGGERPTPGSVVVYSGKNYVLNLAEFLPGLLLPILVLETLGAEANATFFLTWTMATVAFLASKAIAQSAFAALVRDDTPGPAVRKGILLSALALGPAALALLVAAPLLLQLFGPQYASGAPLLRLLALSIPAIAASNLYLAFLKARRAGWELTLLPAVTLGTLLLTLPLALATAGVVGVGLAWLIVQTIAGLYAAARLAVALRRTSHGQLGTALRGRAHQG